jgi:agmatine deiminase
MKTTLFSKNFPEDEITMIADWDTNTLFISDLLDKKYPALVASLRDTLIGVPIEIIPGTADIWCRDYMPIQLDLDRFCQFMYSPDYLLGHEELITPPDRCRLPFMLDYKQQPLFLDGGNIVASRTKVILMEKVYKENPGIERPRLRAMLEEIFQADCIFIPKQAGDDIGHSDGVVRFLDEKRVLMNDYSAADPDYGERVRSVLERKGLEVETFPMFEEKGQRRRGGIEPAVGIYINYLRVGDVVVLPGYDRPEDQEAVKKAKQVMLGVMIYQVPCRNLAEEGGVLNCVSWTIKMDRERT